MELTPTRAARRSLPARLSNNANAVQNSTVTVSANNSLLFNTNSGAITTFNVGGLAGSGNVSLADGSYALTLTSAATGPARPTAARSAARAA